MTDKMDMKVNFDVEVTDLDKAEILRREIARMSQEISTLGRNANASVKSLAALGRSRFQTTNPNEARSAREALSLERERLTELNKQFRFKGRMTAQQRREDQTTEKAIRDQQAETERAFKARMKFNTAMARQRQQEESAAEQAIRNQVLETARLRDREAKKARDEARRAEREHAKALRDAQAGAQRAAGGAGRVAGIGAGVAAGLGYGAERMIGRGISSRTELDTAETNLKIFTDTDDGKGGRRKITNDDIRKLRKGPQGLDAEAIRNGVSVKSALEAYTEVAKAGLIDPMEQTRTLLSGTTALELDPRATTKLMGTMARNMGSAATPARIKRAINALAVGAREDPTQANEIVEGMNRAQPLLAMSKGFSEEDLVGLVSGGQSVGIQPGKAGTFLPAIAREILQGNDKFLSKGKRAELNWAAKNLGFGSAKDLATQFAGAQGKQVYYGILEKLAKMDEGKRAQVANALAGGQWGDELLQHVNGLSGMRKTDAEIHDPRNANFLDEARNEKMKSWAGLWSQSQAIFTLFWESFGVGFDGILREINAFFLDLNGKFNYEQVSQYVRDGLDGLKEGLGLKTWKEGLESIFPSDIGGYGTAIRDFAKGFGEAARSVGSLLRSIGSSFGVTGSAESIGQLAGKFLLLSTAAVALSPVIGVLGGLAGIIMGVAGMARAAMSILGMGGGAAVGGLGGGAVAGALATVGRLLAGGFILSLAGAIGSMRGEIVTLMIDAVKPMISALWEGLRSAFSIDGLKSGGKALLNEIIPAPIQRWLEGGDKPVPGQGTEQSKPWVDPPARGTSEAPAAKTATEKLLEEQQKQTELLQQQLAVDQKALQAVEQQNLNRGTSRDAQVRSLMDDTRRYVRGIEGSVGGGGSAVDGPNIAHSTPGGSLRGVVGQNRNGIIGGSGATGGDNASPDQKSGGSRSWRNNNPGNLEWGPYARSMGATSSDGRFARFPSYEAGRKAQEKLLFEGQNYKNLTLGQAIRRWAPASENNVGAYLKAMGGDDPSKKMSEYSPEQRARLLDAMQRHEGWRPGTITGGGSSSSGSGSSYGPGGNPADVAAAYLGKGEHRDRAAVEQFVGGRITGAANAWCGAFVGASLEAVGQKGTGSKIANSYLHWGKGIAAEMVQKGDVLVEHRGRGDNGLGGHVGFSTGRTRMGRDGQLELEMLAGNTSDQVATTWEKASKLAVRRSTQIAEQAKQSAEIGKSLNGQMTDVGDGIKSSGWKRVGPAGDGAAGPGAGLGSGTPGQSLGQNAPLSNRGTAGANIRGGGGRIGDTNHHITINGYQKDGKELAGEVQRSLQNDMNRRTHDYDGFA